jgi:hypothetical protein
MLTRRFNPRTHNKFLHWKFRDLNRDPAGDTCPGAQTYPSGRSDTAFRERIPADDAKRRESDVVLATGKKRQAS